MSETNTMGHIASFPIPDVQLRIIWVSTRFDPAREADAANALIEQGADVVMQRTDSPAAMTMAGERGVFAFGQASDMRAFGPTARLSSIIDTWKPYCTARARAVPDGTWESIDVWDGNDSAMTEIGGFSARIPLEVRRQAMDAEIAIAAGRLHPFTAPIDRQDGTPGLAPGETATDKELPGMSLYVVGLEGQLADRAP